MSKTQINTSGKTLELTAESCISFYTRYIGEVAAIEKVDAILSTFEDTIPDFPELYAISPELLTLGVPDLRVIHQGGLRLFYKYEAGVAAAMFILTDKQSAEKQLVEHCLLRW